MAAVPPPPGEDRAAGDTPAARRPARGGAPPAAPPPAAAYVPWVEAGGLVYTAGQLPLERGNLVTTGKLGSGVPLEVGKRCARACAVNVLAQLRAALGELSRVRRVVKLTVFVASTSEFHEQHLVANGASELLGQVFGDAGLHARSAVGVACLPMNAPVEVEAVAEIA
jgi:enamine deaminase RidA (YjgF/YER057c/UK114 family)